MSVTARILFTLFPCNGGRSTRSVEKDAGTQDHSWVQGELLSSIASNEDVLFYWSRLSADADEEDAQTLLKMVVELWVTIRGFAFASSWMNSLHAEIICTSPFINAEIKVICLRSKWQALLSKP